MPRTWGPPRPRALSVDPFVLGRQNLCLRRQDVVSWAAPSSLFQAWVTCRTVGAAGPSFFPAPAGARAPGSPAGAAAWIMSVAVVQAPGRLWSCWVLGRNGPVVNICVRRSTAGILLLLRVPKKSSPPPEGPSPSSACGLRLGPDGPLPRQTHRAASIGK